MKGLTNSAKILKFINTRVIYNVYAKSQLNITYTDLL